MFITNISFAGDKFVYTFKKLLIGSGELSYEVESDEQNISIKSTTKIYVARDLVKQVEQISINRKDLSPIKGTFCQYPRPRSGNNSCFAGSYDLFGNYLYFGHESDKPVLMDINPYDANVSAINFEQAFADFSVNSDNVYDIPSFFLLPRYEKLDESSSGRKFYIASQDMKGEIIINVTRINKNVLKYTFTTGAGTDEKISEFVPKYVMFDTNLNVITSLVLRTNFGEVTLNLDKQKSQF